MAILLDGKKVSEYIKSRIREDIENLIKKGIRPKLRIILIGENPASYVYVENKKKASEKMNIDTEILHFEEKITEEEILSEIEKLNKDPEINGIIVQLPLPAHIDEQKISLKIDPLKDVDGFHPFNLGMLLRGSPSVLPATPYGILEILKYYKIETEGKNVVVLGRSNIVGKPAGILFLLKNKFGNATVTICHTKTKNIEDFIKRADILIVAMGVREFVKGNMVKENIVVIDVGIHRVPDSSSKGYRLVGDVLFNEVAKKASYITPVPGGVGPMTVAMLLKNLVEVTKKQNGIYS